MPNAQCPMPHAPCPMPHAQEHLMLLRKAISRVSEGNNCRLRRGVADLGYERLNMPVIEISIHKASGFLTYFFHTLIKQRLRRL